MYNLNYILYVNTILLGEYPEATVMFSDVLDFQSIVPFCKPKNVVFLLNDLFTKFDRLVTIHDVFFI